MRFSVRLDYQFDLRNGSAPTRTGFDRDKVVVIGLLVMVDIVLVITTIVGCRVGLSWPTGTTVSTMGGAGLSRIFFCLHFMIGL